MLHKVKYKLKKFLLKFSNFFKLKVPVEIPVLYSDLLKGRVALITGAGGGLGSEIATSFLKNGCSVILAGRNIEKLKLKMQELKKFIKSDCFIDCVVLDISDIYNLEKNFYEIINKHKIDILVNNAGISGDNNPKNFDHVIRTNLDGTFLLSEYMANYMKKNKIKGNILNVSSSSSLRPAVDPYTISKWGVKGFTLGLAKKYIKYDIVVNGIAPGPTAAGMIKINPDEGINKNNSPAGRYIMPMEIGNLSVVLVSDLSRMVVGDTLYVTGGAAILTYDDIEY